MTGEDQGPHLLEAENRRLTLQLTQLEADLTTARDQQEADLEEATLRHQAKLEAKLEETAIKHQEELEAVEARLLEREHELLQEHQERIKVSHQRRSKFQYEGGGRCCFFSHGTGDLLKFRAGHATILS